VGALTNAAIAEPITAIMGSGVFRIYVAHSFFKLALLEEFLDGQETAHASWRSKTAVKAQNHGALAPAFHNNPGTFLKKHPLD
jgi:hypothetical protein